MEPSSVVSDGDTSVFCSPEGSFESAQSQQFRTSISVSSLTEMFEKGKDNKCEDTGEESVHENISEVDPKDKLDASETNTVKEEKLVSEGASELSTVHNVEVSSCDEQKNKVSSEDTSQRSETANEGNLAGQVVNNGNAQTEKKLPEFQITSSAVQEEKGAALCNNEKSSTSVADSYAESNTDSIFQDLSTQAEIAKVVEERVAYFAVKIASNCVASTAAKDKDTNAISGENEKGIPICESESKFGEVERKISLKDLEQSFVAALNLVNSYGSETEKALDALPVPSIQITEASDQEEMSMDTVEKSKPKTAPEKVTEVETPVLTSTDESDKLKTATEETEVKTSVSTSAGESDTKSKNVEEQSPSCSSNIDSEKKDEMEADEQRKAFFFISSSDLPDLPAETTNEISDELRRRALHLENSAEAARTRSNETKTSSCLCSKSLHGALCLSSFIVGIFGYILYNLAQEGSVPDFCEHIGLVTTVMACVTGAVSCFCFSILEAFPRIPFTGYERMADADDFRLRNRRVNARNLDEESWSSETERAFRRQNGMSSTRTSETSLSKQSYKEVVEKTEKVRKEVVSLLDSFTEMVNQLQPTDEISQMELGAVNDGAAKCDGNAATNVKP